jgi:hypothetical protein
LLLWSKREKLLDDTSRGDPVHDHYRGGSR